MAYSNFSQKHLCGKSFGLYYHNDRTHLNILTCWFYLTKIYELLRSNQHLPFTDWLFNPCELWTYHLYCLFCENIGSNSRFHYWYDAGLENCARSITLVSYYPLQTSLSAVSRSISCGIYTLECALTNSPTICFLGILISKAIVQLSFQSVLKLSLSL